MSKQKQKIEVFENGDTYNEIKDMSIEQSSMNGPQINNVGTIDLQHDQTIFSNMSKDVQLRQGSVKIAKRPTNGGNMQKANFSRKIQPGTASPDTPRKISKMYSVSNQSPKQKSKSIFDRPELKVNQDQKLESICFKEFDLNFQNLHKVRDIKVLDEFNDMLIQKNEMKFRKTATKAFNTENNVLAKKRVEVEKATRTPQWMAQNRRNLPIFKKGLEDSNAFNIQYEPVSEDQGLIEKTRLYKKEDLEDLKKVNELIRDPVTGELVPTPAQEMFDKVIGGTEVQQIQIQKEKDMCQKYVQHVVKGRERCFCDELDKEEDKIFEDNFGTKRTFCNCLCYYKKTNKNTHAMVELAQATLPDEGIGNTHQLFLVQKIADYENFFEEERFGDEEELAGAGRNGKLLIRFFALGDDLKLTMVKKVIINDNVNYQFHPNVITTYQVGNEIYFYQIITDCINEEKQTVLLRSFNLVTQQLQIYDDLECSCEIPLDRVRGPLLAVCFLKQKEHVSSFNQRLKSALRMSATDDEIPTLCNLKSQPVLFIFQKNANEQEKSNDSSY